MSYVITCGMLQVERAASSGLVTFARAKATVHYRAGAPAPHLRLMRPTHAEELGLPFELALRSFVALLGDDAPDDGQVTAPALAQPALAL